MITKPALHSIARVSFMTFNQSKSFITFVGAFYDSHENLSVFIENLLVQKPSKFQNHPFLLSSNLIKYINQDCQTLFRELYSLIIFSIGCVSSKYSFCGKSAVRVVFCLWAVDLTRVMRKIPHFGVRIV